MLLSRSARRARGPSTLAASAVLLLAAAAVTQQPADAEEPERVATAPQQMKVITLPGTVAIDDALSAAANAGVIVLEVRLSGNGVAGGLVPAPGKSPREQATSAEEWFQGRFRQVPAASAVMVPASTPDAQVTTLLTAMAALPRVPVAPAPITVTKDLSAVRGTGRGTVGPLAGSIDEHFPSIWEGDTYTVVQADGTVTREYDYLFEYESAFGAVPATFPDDWGMELGITISNSDLTSRPRPLCGLDGGDSDLDFWSATWEVGGVWATNVPDASAPYPDFNIQSDSCQLNSVELGIGFPGELSQDTTYILAAVLFEGTESSSPMSASVSMKSNDCNDLFMSPNTNCMGLNTDRDPPSGFDGSATLVNQSRNWTVPGCFIFGEGFTDPINLAPGEAFCPTVVVL